MKKQIILVALAVLSSQTYAKESRYGPKALDEYSSYLAMLSMENETLRPVLTIIQPMLFAIKEIQEEADITTSQEGLRAAKAVVRSSLPKTAKHTSRRRRRQRA